MKNYSVSAYSDKGDRRSENQDSIFYVYDRIEGHMAGLYVVADGCGGLKHGAEVSNLITSSFRRAWNELMPDFLSNKKITSEAVFSMLEAQLDEINQKAVDFSESQNEKCGSTVSLLMFIDKKYYIVNVGDSRIYRFKRKGLEQLTEDQTVVSDLLRNKQITEEEARTHKQRHVLSMCVGYFDKLRVFKREGRLRRRDIFLLCSDGLYNYADAGTVIDIAKSDVDFSEAAELMRYSIPEGKARDNVSVIVAKYG